MKKFFNKHGMTYVELLVALALLSLIVVLFSPMLLSSYEQLYKAGEMQEETYIAKSDLEKGLATRTMNNITILKTQMNGVAQDLQISLRTITSDLQDSMQTLFHGGKGSIRIVSPSTVPDDTDAKEFVLQAIGIDIDGIAYGGETKASYAGGKNTVAIEVFKGDHSKTNATDDEAFTVSLAASQVKLPSATEIAASKGTFPITITGCDLTVPVLKIKLYYYDENRVLRDAETYIKITAPTVMLVGRTTGGAGAAGSVAYYTSAGMEQVKGNARSYTETFSVEARQMTGGAYPTGTEFKDVVYVDSDPNPLNNYYVLVGTNGVIQRFYSALNIDGHDNVQSITGTTMEHIFYKDGGLEKIATPAFWGGDKSHQFVWTSNSGALTYGSSDSDNDGDQCWKTESSANSGVGQAGVYSTQAQFSYHYNPTIADKKYNIQKMRTISYILTEKGYPLRLAGSKQAPYDFVAYQRPWEVNTGVACYGQYYENDTLTDFTDDRNSLGVSTTNPDYVVRFRGEKFAVYLDGPQYYVHQFANVNIRALSTINVGDLVNDSTSDVSALNTDDGKKINITSAAYIPQFGGMYYLGTVQAHALIQQVDNCADAVEVKLAKNKLGITKVTLKRGGNSTANYAEKIINNKDGQEAYGRGVFRLYCISGLDDRGTGIYRIVETAADFGGARSSLVSYVGGVYYDYDKYPIISDKSSDGKTVSMAANNNFFIARNNNYALFEDLVFTMGYSSNRESVYSNIVYNGSTEQFKSYEPYYFLSEYGTSSRNPNYATTSSGTYYNHVNNDYYNVWFPGELYNLTHTATRDGITVAVGYTVSGSTYQYINPSQISNTSTALGSVYNDGVLAAVVSGSGNTFQNLLYYKDNSVVDQKSLSVASSLTGHANTQYSTAYGNYGTHSRQNVRFQAVGINCEDLSTSSAAVKTYYAYYGDNRGNVYKSKVATTSGLVSYIASLTNASKDSAPSKMEKLTLTDGTEINSIFKEIISIEAEDDMVIISGTSRDAKDYVVVGVATKTATATTWTWKKVQIVSNDPKIHIKDMMALGGYVYFVGAYYDATTTKETDSSVKGFALAVAQGDIEAVVNDNTKTALDDAAVKKVTNLATPLYAVAGHVK